MNQRIIISVLALSTLIPLTLSSCVVTTTPSEPVHPEPSSSLPDSLEDMTDEDLNNQITVLECPTEARIGEYITVRLRIGDSKFWDWIHQECIDMGEYDSIWLDPFFYAYIDLYREGEGGGYIILGESRLDDNYEAVWYAAIHADDTYGTPPPIKSGVYPLIVGVGEGSGNFILQRNIIIKE